MFRMLLKFVLIFLLFFISSKSIVYRRYKEGSGFLSTTFTQARGLLGPLVHRRLADIADG